MYLFKTTDVKPPHKLVYFDDKTNHMIDHIYVTACPGVSSEWSRRDHSDETPEHAFSKKLAIILHQNLTLTDALIGSRCMFLRLQRLSS